MEEGWRLTEGWGRWGPGAVAVAGCLCPPRWLGRWQTLRELGGRPPPPLVAYFSSPWQLPISVPESHKALPVPSHGRRWGQGRGQRWGGCAQTPPPAPSPGEPGPDPAADPPQPRPRYLRLRLLHLVLRLHELLVDLLQPGGADLGGQSGGQRGPGPPPTPDPPPAPPGQARGWVRAQSRGARLQKAGCEGARGCVGPGVRVHGLGVRVYRAGARARGAQDQDAWGWGNNAQG